MKHFKDNKPSPAKPFIGVTADSSLEALAQAMKPHFPRSYWILERISPTFEAKGMNTVKDILSENAAFLIQSTAERTTDSALSDIHHFLYLNDIKPEWVAPIKYNPRTYLLRGNGIPQR